MKLLAILWASSAGCCGMRVDALREITKLDELGQTDESVFWRIWEDSFAPRVILVGRIFGYEEPET